VHGLHVEAGGHDQRGRRLGVEPALALAATATDWATAGDCTTATAAPSASRAHGSARFVGEQIDRRGDVAGECLGQDRAAAVGDHDARRAARTQDGGDRCEDLRRIVDLLEDAVAQYEIGTLGCDECRELVAVALHAIDKIGDASIDGTTAKAGQRIGAGVDDRDPMSGPRERHGEAAGAATDVDHAEWLARPSIEFGSQRCPDHRGARSGGEPGTGRLHVCRA